jgi:non-specific serine/threonine protein kinase/serine/threonine-protein kinase
MHKTEEVFFAALECEAGEARASFLAQICTDPALRERVERLLARDAQAGDFLQHSASGPTIAAPDPRIENAGILIGPYKLREQIGDGGMGVVYVAEQTRPVRRRVALKIIKPGMDTKQVVGRFEAERQALAMMDHPNIARVHDGGATESGRPYFVMELVRGVPITDYCDREQLSISQRLELFVLVCRAVQHAHQKGIIHRDLKPSNILVTVIDGTAVPKIIDFGVAKATGASLTDRTVYTAFHQFIGTPLYMSPEQADLSGVDVDTRSDIYSLGVLLYELLTGTTPFDQDTLRAAAFDEVRRIIREVEPPRPSTRLSTLGESLSAVSGKRKTVPKQLNHVLRGDLDWVVMRALEKDRRRRYDTANDFAADVMRYLADKPVEACPPSVWYRSRKFVHRNRLALAAAALVATTLVAGIAVSLWQARKARLAAAEAQMLADESKQVIDYLAKDVFGAAPGKGHGRSTTVGLLLDEADATVGTRFQRQPLVEAGIRLALSQAYHQLPDSKRAEVHAARAAEIRQRVLGPEHPATLDARVQQAWVLSDRGWGWSGNPDNPRAAQAAEQILRPVLAARRRVLGPLHPDTLWAELLLANTVSHLGRLEEAEQLASKTGELAVRVLGPEHLTSIHALGVMALIAQRQRNLDRAENLYRQSLAACERVFGRLEHPTVQNLKDLAYVVREQGRTEDAQRLLIETIDRFKQVYGLSHINTSAQIGLLWETLRAEHDYAAIRDLSERWLRELLATPDEVDPYQRSRRSIRLAHLGLALASLPRTLPFDGDLAVRAAEQAVAQDDDHHDAWSILGAVYYRVGRLDDAMRTIQTSVTRPKWKGGDDFDWLVLALIHARRGEMDQARAWYEKARNRKDPRHFNHVDLKPLLDEAESLLALQPAPGRATSQPTENSTSSSK